MGLAVGVEPGVGGDAGGVEVAIDAGTQVERSAIQFRLARIARRFAVFDLVDQDVAVQRARVGGRLTVGDGAAHGLLHRAAQLVVVVVKLWPRLSQARMGLPATSFNIQRAPASMLSWWMRLPSMS
jgi:hypothetical protein